MDRRLEMDAQSQDLEFQKIVILPDGRMTTSNAAAYLGLSEKTLAMFRTQGTGPLFIKKGRVFYFREDLDAWLNESKRVTSTAQHRANESMGG